MWLLVGAAVAAPEALEIGPGNTADLPGGREADGIIGDFVLRNDRIEAVISGNLHERKANMGTMWDAPTPGCLYDLTPRGANNDQLTWLGPGVQKGQLSSVRVLKDGREGEAIVRAELTAAAGQGLGKTHDYILRDGWRHLVMVSTYYNAGSKSVKIKPGPAYAGLVGVTETNGITTGLCHDPDDRLGYAYGPIDWPDARPARGEIELAAGQEARFAAAAAVGNGTADAYGVLAGLAGPSHRFSGRVLDAAGRPAPHAVLSFQAPGGQHPLVSYAGNDGSFELTWPEATAQVRVKDLGRPDVEADLKSGTAQGIQVSPAAGVAVKVTDESGHPLPCKVQFIGSKDNPDLGPVIRAHGCANQYHSENGRFTQHLPPDTYRIVITRGIEYDHAERSVEVPEGRIVPVEAVLRRAVDTRGWVSSDFHNHTTVSGDNYCGTDDRIINLAAEHIEFAPATEHNRIYEWQPHIDRLNLQGHVATVTGIELTGGGPHLNAFPLQPKPFSQSNGAPSWHPDPRVSALLLRNLPGDESSRWVHLNHPNVARFFNDRDGDGKADGGFEHLESLVDAAEVYGERILSNESYYDYNYKGRKGRRENWPLAWLQLINAGRGVWTIATSDAHEITRGGVGGWRTYLPSSTDQPAQLKPKELIAQAKAGRCFVTSGPFLQVVASDGHGPGDTVVSSEPIALKIRVQCNTWVEIDRVVVLVNGRIVPDFDFRRSAHPEKFRRHTVCFEQTVTVPLASDAHLIVVAAGEAHTLATGYGESWQADLHPVAYNNPIFIDVDGNGFQANGDTLGGPFLPLPSK